MDERAKKVLPILWVKLCSFFRLNIWIEFEQEQTVYVKHRQTRLCCAAAAAIDPVRYPIFLPWAKFSMIRD